jgi:hypothetical protein
MAVAGVVVMAVVFAALMLGGRSKRAEDAAASAAPDPYAANLAIGNLAMSEAANLAGGKVTYVNGHIANHGERTVTGAWVQVTFRDYKRDVAQSQKVPLTVIRMREPYIDTGLLSLAPLKPAGEADFRLNFDAVSPDWAGALPEIRVVRVESK